MNTKWIFLALVLFALTARPVDAYYGANLQVSSALIQFCPCDMVSSDEISVRISNYGSHTDTYSFSLGLPKGWSGFIKPKVTLASGESAIIDPVWVTAPCGSEAGEFKVTVAAKSASSGKEYSEDLDITVLSCYDVGIESEGYLRTCKNEGLAAEVTIANMGKMDDKYMISASPEWVMVSPAYVSMDAWDSETVSLTILPPSGRIGVENITIRAESELSYAEAEEVIKLTIQPCYVFEASVSPPSDTVCIGSSSTYVLNIDNVGTESDTYSIVTPNWITAEFDSIRIDSQSRGSVRLTAEPTTRGRLDVVASVSSKKHPSSVVDAASTINAVDCRSVAVSLSGSKEVCKGDGASFVARVENTGTVVTSYQLSPSVGELDRTKVVLGPGDVQNVILKIDQTTKVGPQAVSVLAYDGNVSDEDSTTLNVQNCYDAVLEVVPEETGACKGDTLTIDAHIKNAGDLEDEYTLKYGGKVSEFGLDSGESRSVQAKVPVDYLWGSDNEVLFVLKSANGVHIEQPASIEVLKKLDCYSVGLSIVNGDELKEKEASLAIGYGVALELAIENNGLRADSYDIIVDGPDWAYISEDSFFLTPLQREELYLYLSPPYEAEEREYAITVIANSDLALSGVEIKATVQREPSTGQVSVNITSAENVTDFSWFQPSGLTGQFLGAEGLSIEALSVAAMVIAAAAILVLRFVVFK
ncbi:MAG: hypothetical protein JXC85_00155 [Candidatus Aenigmarchaeota archaeon]|nr:hypothetical protein [Candidatus Aenigmarchaeota archaeon]